MPNAPSPRIAAVVVTYNRLPVLQRLVERLRRIPELDEILVVDNASTDGTAEWLAAQPVRTRLLESNTGGAGGFHTGMATAMEYDVDLIWLMDDDGMPAPDCLRQLLGRADTHDFLGPLVVDEARPEELVFPIRLPGGTRVVHHTAAAAAAARDGVLDGIVIPFNGVLVARELVGRVGLPRAEFFIWGDDHEYRLRAERAGARIGTVTDARVEHPSIGDLGTPMMFGRTAYNHTPSDLKHYCMARNNLVNLREYRGLLYALAFVLKTLWFYLFTRPDPSRIRMSLRAMSDGLRGDFSGHQRYLG